MEAKLIVVSGKTNRGEVALKLPATIGRSRQATLTVAHPMISRQHCEIYERDGLLMLRDLGSLNGVLLEGKRVTEAPLPPGTEFVVGPLTLRVEYEYAGDLAALPPVQEHAETAAAEDTSPVAAVSDTADLPATAVDETAPAPQLSNVEETAVEQIPAVAAAAAAPADDDDLGFSFLDESPAPSAAAEEPLEFETPGEGESAAVDSETMEFEAPADVETTQFDTAAAEPEPAAETETLDFEGEAVKPEPAADSETMDFESAGGGEEPAGEADVASPAAKGDRDAKKKAGGWWRFAGKGEEQGSKAAKKASPAKAAAPAKKAEVPAAKKSAEPEVDFDELAFAALQDEPAEGAPQAKAAKKAPVKPEDEDLDSFLQGLE
jgi:predicted component of type VI protein secretion system